MDFEGLLAVELFLDTEGRILVNEVAPAPTTVDITPSKPM